MCVVRTVDIQSEIRSGKRRASAPASRLGVRKIRYTAHPQTGRDGTPGRLRMRSIEGEIRDVREDICDIVHANLVICGNEKWMWIRKGKRFRRR